MFMIDRTGGKGGDTFWSQTSCDERLLDALLYATLNPDTHNQDTWGHTDRADHNWSGGQIPCGTQACLFGTAVIRAGLADVGELVPVMDTEVRFWININARGKELIAQRTNGALRMSWDEGHDFVVLGALLFGLDLDQAATLSGGGQSLLHLWCLAGEFTNGRVRMPSELEVTVKQIDAANFVASENWGGGSWTSDTDTI